MGRCQEDAGLCRQTAELLCRSILPEIQTVLQRFQKVLAFQRGTEVVQYLVTTGDVIDLTQKLCKLRVIVFGCLDIRHPAENIFLCLITDFLIIVDGIIFLRIA